MERKYYLLLQRSKAEDLSDVKELNVIYRAGNGAALPHVDFTNVEA